MNILIAIAISFSILLFQFPAGGSSPVVKFRAPVPARVGKEKVQGVFFERGTAVQIAVNDGCRAYRAGSYYCATNGVARTFTISVKAFTGQCATAQFLTVSGKKVGGGRYCRK